MAICITPKCVERGERGAKYINNQQNAFLHDSLLERGEQYAKQDEKMQISRQKVGDQRQQPISLLVQWLGLAEGKDLWLQSPVPAGKGKP